MAETVAVASQEVRNFVAVMPVVRTWRKSSKPKEKDLRLGAFAELTESVKYCEHITKNVFVAKVIEDFSNHKSLIF